MVMVQTKSNPTSQIASRRLVARVSKSLFCHQNSLPHPIGPLFSSFPKFPYPSKLINSFSQIPFPKFSNPKPQTLTLCKNSQPYTKIPKLSHISLTEFIPTVPNPSLFSPPFAVPCSTIFPLVPELKYITKRQSNTVSYISSHLSKVICIPIVMSSGHSSDYKLETQSDSPMEEHAPS